MQKIVDLDIAEPQGKQISEETIHQIMESMERRLHFCTKALKEGVLPIISITHSLEDDRCVCIADLYPFQGKKVLEEYILVPYIKNNSYSPEYLFLCSLGYVLQGRVTNQLKAPPESFKDIMAEAFPEGFVFSPQGQRDLFANCFAMAAMVDSEFSELAPCRQIPVEQKRRLKLYMENLLNALYYRC